MYDEKTWIPARTSIKPLNTLYSDTSSRLFTDIQIKKKKFYKSKNKLKLQQIRTPLNICITKLMLYQRNNIDIIFLLRPLQIRGRPHIRTSEI